VDHLAFERHRAAERCTGLGRQRFFETRVKGEVAGMDNEVTHSIGLVMGDEKNRWRVPDCSRASKKQAPFQPIRGHFS
jgi:hypothetical protein